MSELSKEVLEEMVEVMIGSVPNDMKIHAPTMKQIIMKELRETPHAELKNQMITQFAWIAEKILPALNDEEIINHSKLLYFTLNQLKAIEQKTIGD